MKIRLVWVGRTKEQFIDEGVKKYLRLIKPFGHVSIVEIKEEKGKDTQRMVETESQRILKLQMPYVLLDEKGKGFSSAEFADFISRHSPMITFVIGGAYGVSEGVRDVAETKLALSKMTLTHEMARLFLVEQIYRALTIMHKRGYHH